jgi:hypothetical protein
MLGGWFPVRPTIVRYADGGAAADLVEQDGQTTAVVAGQAYTWPSETTAWRCYPRRMPAWDPPSTLAP